MKSVITKFVTAIFCLTVVTGAFAANISSSFAKPTVVVIKADWCGACQKVDPILKSVVNEYKGRVNLVVLDVTDESAEAVSMKKAKSLGLGSFFNANKRKTSTVAIFNGSTKVFQTYKNYNRGAYVRGFEKALE